MTPILNAIAIGLAMIGLRLNIDRRRSCFIVWLFSNAYWLAHNVQIGEYCQAVLYGIFFGVSIYGFWAWGRAAGTDPSLRAARISIDILAGDLERYRGLVKRAHRFFSDFTERIPGPEERVKVTDLLKEAETLKRLTR